MILKNKSIYRHYKTKFEENTGKLYSSRLESGSEHSYINFCMTFFVTIQQQKEGYLSDLT